MIRLRKVLSEDLLIIPDFVDTKSSTHRSCYDILSNEIYPLLFKCVSNKFLPGPIISNINWEIMCFINDMRFISEDDLHYRMYKYLVDLIKDYEGVSVYLDLYESASNFNNLLINITNIRERDIKDVEKTSGQ